MHIVSKMACPCLWIASFIFKILLVIQIVTCVEIVKYSYGTDIAKLYKRHKRHSHFNNEAERANRFLTIPGFKLEERTT